jgi:hypothetical protein
MDDNKLAIDKRQTQVTEGNPLGLRTRDHTAIAANFVGKLRIIVYSAVFD